MYADQLKRKKRKKLGKVLKFSEDVSCVFYDFDINGFSDEGLETLSVNRTSDDRTVVQCASNHLTSFAVLVNVAGVDVRVLEHVHVL